MSCVKSGIVHVGERMDKLSVGMHLITPRLRLGKSWLYDHHGIFVGDQKVIHYSGMATALSKGPIQETPLEEFIAGYPYKTERHLKPKFSGDQAAHRAKEALEKPSRYNLMFNNCEHFVNWCIEDDAVSLQVERVGAIAAGPVTGPPFGAALAFGATPLVAAETVAGLSGPGLLSGLAWVGSWVGGGAVVGLAGMAAAPALISSTIINLTLLRDRQWLGSDERLARRAARKGAYAGAAMGTAGSVASVYAFGSVAGISGPGIASGLAAIGLGGGMATGIAIAVAARTLAAGAIAYSVYRLAKWHYSEPTETVSEAAETEG
jgi:hypothetical protein